MLTQPKLVEEKNGSVKSPEATGVEPAEVREQLERLIASPGLSQSRRYSRLLRFIVESAVDGHADQLKERTIGIEVFERSPAYDTSTDPVVRTTAAQLRRRIAQYYGQSEHERELVIDLPPGAYVPEFRRPPVTDTATHPVMASDDAGIRVGKTSTGSGKPEKKSFRTWFLLALGLGVLVLLGIVCFVLVRSKEPDAALKAFWGPVWDSSPYVTVVMGRASGDPELNVSAATGNPGLTVSESLVLNRIAWPDAITMSSVVGVARLHGKESHLRRASATPFADLRDAPAVLVGGFNNSWIMRLQSVLRFKMNRDQQLGISWIEDQQHPSLRTWTTNYNAPFSALDQDYGFIARIIDPTTERPLVFACGLASYGTIAAGEFLANEKYMRLLADRAPRGWEHKNVEAVFSTKVINANSGAPFILETYFW